MCVCVCVCMCVCVCACVCTCVCMGRVGIRVVTWYTKVGLSWEQAHSASCSDAHKKQLCLPYGY